MIEIASYGPWAVITGASTGIGKAFAEQLAAAGLDLVLAARSTEQLESLGRELERAHGTSYRVVTLDLSDPEAASVLAETTADLDVGLLVSNAGGGRPGLLLEQPLDALHRRHVLNATSHLDLVHAFGRRFAARRRAGIILVSAFGAGQGLPNMAHDGASKAYVLSLGKALHYELAQAGVAVTVLLPGNVETPVIDKLGVDRSSLPVRPQPAANAVRGSINAFLKGRAVYIPGRMMRLVERFMPPSASARMNGRMLGAAARNLAERERLGAA